jgi:hypothetical protein
VLGPLVKCQIRLDSAVVDLDIQKFIRQQLQDNRKLKKLPKEIHYEIEQALVKGAHGVYVPLPFVTFHNSNLTTF